MAKPKYYRRSDATELWLHSIALCRCQEWSDIGYQVAHWDGKKFYLTSAELDGFDKFVTEFMPLDNDGRPMLLPNRSPARNPLIDDEIDDI